MKASNKWMIGLGIVFISLFLANIWYHKYMFEKKKTTLPPKAVFESQRDRIKVVILVDSTKKACNNINIFRPEKKNNSFINIEGGKDLQKTFFENIRYSHDTMYIDLGEVTWNESADGNPHVRFTMQRLEKIYYNGHLQKNF